MKKDGKLNLTLPEKDFSNTSFIVKEENGIVSLITDEKETFNSDEIEMVEELCNKGICKIDDLYTEELAEYLEKMQLIEDLKLLQHQVNCKIGEIIKKYDSNK